MKQIKGYEDYYITTCGRIISTKGNGFKILKQRDNDRGYKIVSLSKDGKRKLYKVHRLVALAYIDNPDSKPQVNHINENKEDNYISNLEWMTNKENVNHGTRNNRISGAKNGMSKPKEYYSTKTTRRSDFKQTCRRMGWDFNSFTEIFFDDKSCKTKKYYYKIIGGKI